MKRIFMPILTSLLLTGLLGAATTALGQPASAPRAGGRDRTVEVSPETLRQLGRQLELTRRAARIVGGEQVAISDFPWQVALVQGRFADPQRSQFCGGSVIASQWILTAAHCVDNSIVRKDPARVDVVAGTAIYAAGGERLKVTEVIAHPQYNRNNNEFDFALLRLSAPVTLGQPIALAAADAQVTPNTPAWVTGWGATVEGGPGSLDLLGAEVPVVTNEVCNQPESYAGDVTAAMLCAGQRAGGVDSCQGDSGGPLATDQQGRKTLIGVVSFGEGCARRLKYGVYARVSAAAAWIASTTAATATRR